MARGDTQRDFANAAIQDGIRLGPQSFPWLCQRGHLALPDDAADARALIQRVYVALGGNLDILADARSTSLPGDFLHAETGTLIEIDESQHFTSARITTLDLYPNDFQPGFDVGHYRALCREWLHESDGYYRTKEARGFGVGGRQRQRAYYDALRDLATPAMGHPPLIRIDAPTRNGSAAYAAHRERLLAALTGP